MKTVIRNFIAWLFASMLEELKKHTTTLRIDFEHALIAVLKTVRQDLRAARPKAYVTVRGVLWHGEKPYKHGWTQSAEIAEGNQASVLFHPFARFDVEQVDVLGPASIIDVRVGNLMGVNSPFDAPATVELRETCAPGSVVRVTIEGLP